MAKAAHTCVQSDLLSAETRTEQHNVQREDAAARTEQILGRCQDEEREQKRENWEKREEEVREYVQLPPPDVRPSPPKKQVPKP